MKQEQTSHSGGQPPFAAQRKNRTTGWLFFASFLALLVASLLFAWKAYRLQEELDSGAPRARAVSVRQLIHSTQLTSTGEKVEPVTLSERYLVLFVTTPLDCAPCREELASMENISGIRPDIAVIALASHSSPQEIEQTRSSFGLSFPLIVDPSGELLESLNVPETPWKIVYDLTTDRVRLEDPRSITDDEKRAFLTRLSQL